MFNLIHITIYRELLDYEKIFKTTPTPTLLAATLIIVINSVIFEDIIGKLYSV